MTTLDEKKQEEEQEICAYCRKLAQGNFSIHRDDFGVGPEVPLCDECGKDPTPTCEQIWKRISHLLN